MTGRIAGADPDVFWAEIPGDLAGELVINARSQEFQLRVLDDAGGQICAERRLRCCDLAGEIDGPGYYIVLEADDAGA